MTPINRRQWLGFGLGFALCGGCTPRGEERHAELVWGRLGVGEGRFQKPRAVAIDKNDLLYIVDTTARIQVFDADGKFLRVWRTPQSQNGRPTGLAFDRDGRLAVADTHYYRVLFYSSEGKLIEVFGGKSGQGPGEFGFVTDVAQDTDGNYYVAEYGEFDRIQKFSRERKFLQQWGGHGSEPGQFLRPQKMVFDGDGRLWVTDACNHRIQVFDREGKMLNVWGQPGPAPGQLSYPYDLAFSDDGALYVCEYGNHRVQKFTLEGKSLGTWGHNGRREGELFNPWGLVCDHRGRIHVLDSNNHRIQRIRL